MVLLRKRSQNSFLLLFSFTVMRQTTHQSRRDLLPPKTILVFLLLEKPGFQSILRELSLLDKERKWNVPKSLLLIIVQNVGYYYC